MPKYLKVMFGTQSGASNFEYKLGEVNIANIWNPNESDPKKMGGFNFSVESKILRWLIRGDTIYDVDLPDDAEVIDCPSESAPHGVFRSNKIIISNPRPVTDDMAMELYKKSDLPEKSYFKAMAGCAVRGYINTALKIFEDKINDENVELAISEFEDFCKPNDESHFDTDKYLNNNTRIIYDKLTQTINSKKKEFIDVYNKNKEKTGKIVLREKGVSLDKGEFIISITAWIVNKQGKILMTQRKLDKVKGGMWEPTTGLVISGETSKQGALRELNEEIGIELEEQDIDLVKEIIEERSDLNFFRDIYLVKEEIDIKDIKFNDGEVINAKYVTLAEFNNMIKNKKTHDWLKYFNELYEEIF